MDKFKLVLHRTVLYLLYALALFPLLPRGVESVLMIAIFILSLSYYIFNVTKIHDKNTIKRVLVFSTLFFIYLISLSYSSNLSDGVDYLIKVLPILVFPIVFGVFLKGFLNNKELSSLFTIYFYAVFLNLLFVQITLHFNLNTVELSNWEYRNAFEDFTGVHGTYYSIWIAFALFLAYFKAEQFLKQRNFTFLILIGTIAVYLIYWQLRLGARFPQILTVILLVITFFRRAKKQSYKLVGLVGLLIFIATVFITKPNFLQRTKNIANYDFSLPKGDYNYDFETITNEQIRNGIYFCSWSLIKDNWLIGYGIGDVDENLQHCYDDKIESNVYNMFNYNSHNQYLHIWLTAGIFGLIFFIVSLTFSLGIAFLKGNWLFLLFSLLIVFSLLTENILSRHDGILFYSFFNAIFAFTSNKEQIY